MSSLRLSRNLIVPAAFMVLLVIPLLTTAFAPILAPIPEASAGWTAPPLPDRDEPLPGFQHLLEPLPIVVRDLPDTESQGVVAIYNETKITDFDGIRGMLEAAHSAVPVPGHLESDWNNWFNQYLDDPLDAGDIPANVLETLSGDITNGDRLNNFAVALFYYGITRTDNEYRFNTYNLGAYNSVLRLSVSLLGTIVEQYPESRAGILNYVYLSRLLGSGHLESMQLIEDWLKTQPNDVTAIHLLGTIAPGSPENRYYNVEPGLVVSRVLDSSDSSERSLASMSHMILGDIKLNQAYLNRAAAPFLAIDLAYEALGHYDQALTLSDDVAIYIARAAALKFLGHGAEAVETLEYAVNRNSSSVGLRTFLAELYLEQIQDGEEVDSAAQKSFDMNASALSIAIESDPPLLSSIMMHPYPGEDEHAPKGLGVNRMHLPYVVLGTLSGGRGAGILYSFDLITARHNVPLRLSDTSYQRPFDGMVVASVMLGNPDMVVESYEIIEQMILDSNWFWGVTQLDPELRIGAESAARLVRDWSSPDIDDLSLSWIWSAQVMRYAGMSERAASICALASDLEIPVVQNGLGVTPQACEAQNLYLIGRYSESRQKYESFGNNFMAGFVAERSGDSEGAIRLYESVLDEADSNELVSLRLAGLLIQRGDYIEGIARYSDWIDQSEQWECSSASCLGGNSAQRPTTYSNRGAARLQAQAEERGAVDCAGDARDDCLATAKDFDAALAYDPYNPVFLMNRAWVARLLGDHDLSTELMTRALESDPTLYPVLVDMGVYAADNDDPELAHQYFLDAVAANPEYDLGWWNLGVLEMKKGPRGIIRGQAYLARAVVQNPSLVTEPLSFKTDESIYRVEVTKENQPGSAWSFGTSSSLATTAFGFVAFVMIIFQASKEVFKDKVIEEAMNRSEKARTWIAENVNPLLQRVQRFQWSALVLLLITVMVMMLAAIIPAWRGDSGAAGASIALAVFAIIFAVITHEFGHRLSARMMNAELETVQWTPGIGVSLLLLPFNLSSGPFPAQRVKSHDQTDTLWVYLFGPVANLGMALAMYTLYLIQPLPILRIIAITQLAVMSYSLLPFEPLDGAPLSKAQPKLIGGIASFALLAGVLFSVGIL